MKKLKVSFWLPFTAVIIVLLYGFIMRLHYDKKRGLNITEVDKSEVAEQSMN